MEQVHLEVHNSFEGGENMRKIYQKGFTLIELMIVITVIAILSAIVLFGLGQAQKAARDTQRAQNIKAIQVALQSSYTNNGVYPAASGTWIPNMSADYLPNAVTDPGCGTAASTFDVRTVASGCAGVVVYAYSLGVAYACPTGSPYSMQLTKESGGLQKFCGPQ